MQKKLLLLSFIEGSAVMAAELCGAKLLAPVFGSSLYIWATVMGSTLFALAAGYFFGGRLSVTAKNATKALYKLLNAAALFLLAMPLISNYLVPRISYLPFMQGVLLSTFILLFIPIFLLGATSPLFILLQSKESGDAGKVSGLVYAVSTLGGIISTFLCGFYLIPQLGLQATVFSFGVLLFVANWILIKTNVPLHFLILLLFVYLNYQLFHFKQKLLFSTDGIMGKLVVQDLQSGKNDVRILKINEIIQTEMDKTTGKSTSAYVQVLDSLIPISTTNGNALVLGLGGGLTSNLLVEKKYATVAVEFDQRIIDASLSYFQLNPKVNYSCEDARRFLNETKTIYDIVLVDVFKAEEQPGYVVTKESLENLKHNLKNSSRVYINWHGYLKNEIGMGTAILFQTLLNCGYEVKLCSVSNKENERNLIFVASLSQLPQLAYEIHEVPLKTHLVNTDDQPLLERYNAEANKTWRTLYLRHYQNESVN